MPTAPYRHSDDIYRDFVRKTLPAVPRRPGSARPEREYDIQPPSVVHALGPGATGITPRARPPERLPLSPEARIQRRTAAEGRGAALVAKHGPIPAEAIFQRLRTHDPEDVGDAVALARGAAIANLQAQGRTPEQLDAVRARFDQIEKVMTEEAYKRTRETELETGTVERAQSLHPSIEGKEETFETLSQVGRKEFGGLFAGGTVSQLIRTPAKFLAREPAHKRDIDVQPPGVVHALGPGASAVAPDLGRLHVPEAAPIADWADQVLKDHPHWTPKQWEAGVGALEDPLAMMDSIISSIPLMAASVLSTSAGHPEAAMMLIYSVEAQNAYEEAFEYAMAQPGATEQGAKIEAERIGQIVGVAVSISEYFQIKGIMRVTGLLKKGGRTALRKTILGITRKVYGANGGAHLASLAKDVLIETGKEYGQEFSQEVMQTLIPTVMQGREFNTFDMLEMIDRANKAGLSVAPLALVPGGARLAVKGAQAVTKRVKPGAAPTVPTEPAPAAEAPPAPAEKAAEAVTAKPAAKVAPVVPEAPKAREQAVTPAEKEAPAVTKPVTPVTKAVTPAAPEAEAKLSEAEFAKLTRQTHEIPRDEYVERHYEGHVTRFRDRQDLRLGRDELVKEARQLHFQAVAQAVNEGKPVSAEVLAPYPKLAALAKKVAVKPKPAKKAKRKAAPPPTPAYEAVVEARRKRAEKVDREAKQRREAKRKTAAEKKEGKARRAEHRKNLKTSKARKIGKGKKFAYENSLNVGAGAVRMTIPTAHEPVPGIVIARHPTKFTTNAEGTEGTPTKFHGWDIMHRDSGLRILQATNKANAIKIAEAVKDVVNWEGSAKEIGKSKVHNALLDVIGQFSGKKIIVELATPELIEPETEGAKAKREHIAKLGKAAPAPAVTPAAEKGAKPVRRFDTKEIIDAMVDVSRRDATEYRAALEDLDYDELLEKFRKLPEYVHKAAEKARRTAAEKGDVTTAGDYNEKYGVPGGVQRFDSDEAARRERADYLLVFANDTNRDLFHRQAYAKAAAKVLDPTKVVGDVRKFTKEDWLDIKGIGPKIAAKLAEGFADRSAEIVEIAHAQQVAAEKKKPKEPKAKVLGVARIEAAKKPKARKKKSKKPKAPKKSKAVAGLEVGGVFRRAVDVAAEAAANVEGQAKHIRETLASEIPEKAVGKRKGPLRRFMTESQPNPDTVTLELGPAEGSVAHDVLHNKVVEGSDTATDMMQQAMDVMRQADEGGAIDRGGYIRRALRRIGNLGRRSRKRFKIWGNPKEFAKWSYDATKGKKVEYLDVAMPSGGAQFMRLGPDGKLASGEMPKSLKLARSDIMDFAWSMRDPYQRKRVEAGSPWVFDRGPAVPSVPIAFTRAGIDAVIGAVDSQMKPFIDAAMTHTNEDAAPVMFRTWLEDHGQNLVGKAQPNHVPSVRHPDYIDKSDPAAVGVKPQTATDYIRDLVLDDMNIFKPRTGGLTPFKGRDFFSRFIEHMHKVSQYTGLSIPIKNARWLLDDPVFKTSVAKAGAKDHTSFVRKWLADVEGMKVQEIPPNLRLIRWIRNQVYNTALLLNVFTGAKMASSYVLAWNEIKARHLAAALTPKDISIKGIQQIFMERSPFLRNRIDDAGVNLVGPTVNHNVLQKFYTGKTGLWREPLAWVLRKGDRMAITRIGRAAYSEGKALGRTGEALARYTARRTEFIVRKTQPTWGAVYQSALARQAHTDWFALVSTMFTSQTNKNYNMVRQAAWVAKNEGKSGFAAKQKARGKFLLIFANTVLLNTIVQVGINEVRRWVLRGFRPRDDEDKWGPLDYAVDGVGQMARIFYGGKVAADFARAIFKGYGRRFPSDPAESLMDDAVRAAGDMAKAGQQWYEEERYTRGPKEGELKAATTALNALKRSRRMGFTIFGIPNFPYQVGKAFMPPEKAAPSKPKRRKWKTTRTKRRKWKTQR